MVYIVMGVSGSGKTTVGGLLAAKLLLPFYDADDFHSKENVNKMNAGIPLTDEDRISWLQRLQQLVQQWDQKGGAVLACSALKEKYREILDPTESMVCWIFLNASEELLQERLKRRKNHFMPPALLRSQIEALEQPDYGIHVSVDDQPSAIVDEIINQLS